MRGFRIRPQPFVLAAASHGPMIVSRLDFCQAPSGAIYGVGSQIFSLGSYDYDEIEFVVDLVHDIEHRRGPGGTFVDCGANIGVHTIEIAKRTELQVVAFEAQERIYYALAGNIALNNCFSAKAIWAAVGSFSGEIEIPKLDYNRPASFGSLELKFSDRTEFIGQTVSYQKKNLQKIPQVSLDTMENLGRVDFIKIDVEGMELDVLNGGKELIERCRPWILVEWIKTGTGPICDFLAPLGYEIQDSVGGNLLAIPKDS